MPLPSKLDQSLSNKGSMGILPAGSTSQKQISTTTTPTPLPQQQLLVHGACVSPCVPQLSTEGDVTLTFSDRFVLGRPVACCHESVLMVNSCCGDEKLALFNPSTKHKTLLPRSPHQPPTAHYSWNMGFYGLGLDPKSNNDDDYKVINHCLFMGKDVVELYSLKTGSWKGIPFPHGRHDLGVVIHDPIHINGFSYWMVGSGPRERDLVIFSFDFATESFPSTLIPGPPGVPPFFSCFELQQPHHFLLAEKEGSLALVVFGKHKKQLELWVYRGFDVPPWTREGAWAVVGAVVSNPLAFLKNRLFYFEDDEGELVLFDCATQKLKYLGVSATLPHSLIMFPYYVSLETTHCSKRRHFRAPKYKKGAVRLAMTQRLRRRGPPPMAKPGASRPEHVVDRDKTCPFLLRIFTKVGGHHTDDDFAVRGKEPKDEVQIYTWLDATLRELTDLVKGVAEEAKPRRNAILSFSFVYPDERGRFVVREVGRTYSRTNLWRPDDGGKALGDLGFQMGDFLDVAIF